MGKGAGGGRKGRADVEADVVDDEEQEEAASSTLARTVLHS